MTDDGTQNDRNVLAEQLLAYAGDATPADVEHVLTTIEQVYTPGDPEEAMRMIAAVVRATGVPPPVAAIYFATRARDDHGIALALVEALHRTLAEDAEQTRTLGPADPFTVVLTSAEMLRAALVGVWRTLKRRGGTMTH